MYLRIHIKGPEARAAYAKYAVYFMNQEQEVIFYSDEM